jgi:hypothetical protein
MAELKTRQTGRSVEGFLQSIPDAERRRECLAVLRIMKKATRAAPKMWGPSIVGFGSYHYKYDSGREGEWFLTGFSPRKQNLTLYIMAGFDRYEALMGKLGRHKTGKSCLYVRRLDDIDLDVLAELVQRSVEHMVRTHR